MTIITPTKTPSTIFAGINADWKRQFLDYLYSDGWRITYYLVDQGYQYTILGTDNGDGFHRFTKLASDTTGYVAGNYSYTAVAVNDVNKVIVETGLITVKADFIAASSGMDARSPTKVILDNINNAILQLSTKIAAEVTINGKTYKLNSINELIQIKSHYQFLYNQELLNNDLANGLPDRRKIYARFAPRW